MAETTNNPEWLYRGDLFAAVKTGYVSPDHPDFQQLIAHYGFSEVKFPEFVEKYRGLLEEEGFDIDDEGIWSFAIERRIFSTDPNRVIAYATRRVTEAYEEVMS